MMSLYYRLLQNAAKYPCLDMLRHGSADILFCTEKKLRDSKSALESGKKKDL